MAETYIAGDWSTPHLPSLLSLLVANRREVEDMVYGSWLGRLAYRVRHLLNRNTRTNSRRNIHAHYDLGNAFYRLWLDETMNYSSAWFETPDQPMAMAQHAKVRRALQQAGVRPGDRVLEIGCGWGALAEKAVTEFDASLVGVTLSTEQLEFAQQRMRRIGREHQADLRLQDYRDIDDAPFDAICSIEMVEAVGRAYWPTYFETVARLLKPGWTRVHPEHRDRRRALRALHQGHGLHPAVHLPGRAACPARASCAQQAAQAGLDVVDEFAFGQHYARTLSLWRERFPAGTGTCAAARFRPALPAHLGVLPRVLRGCCSSVRASTSCQYTLRKPA